MAFDSTTFKEVIVEDDSTNILKEARKHIENGFCKGFAAKDVNGWNVKPMSECATSFCSLGALSRVFMKNKNNTPQLPDDVYYESISRLASAISPGVVRELYIDNFDVVVTYNDSHTKEEVLAMFDKAIGE